MALRGKGMPVALVGLGVGLLIAIIAVVPDRTSESIPADLVLWPDLRGNCTSPRLDDVGKLRCDLQSIVFDEISFKKIPFSECLAQIENRIVSEFPRMEPISWIVEPNLAKSAPITLQVEKIPAMILLEYLGTLSGSRPDFESDRQVVFAAPFGNEERFREEGWFQIPRSIFSSANSKLELIGVADELRDAGVDLESGDLAIYYPKSELLCAWAGHHKLEQIDAHAAAASMCQTPTCMDRIAGWWHTAISGFRTPAASPITTPVSDPF